MTARCVGIVIADRLPLILHGLSAILRTETGFNVVAMCQDGETCVKSIQVLLPDVALIDPSLPRYDGFQVLAAVNRGRLSTRVVYLSRSFDPSDEEKAIARGAYGIIPKDVTAEMLLESLRQVTLGRRLSSLLGAKRKNGHAAPARRNDFAISLTEREREIMHLVCAGLSNKQIGRQLSLSDGTIKVHLHHVYRKLAIQNRTALAALGASDVEDRLEVSATGQ